jgi:hypothetical protein
MQGSANRFGAINQDFTWFILLFFSLVWLAFIHSRAYSTNDASRMASIESLVHRGTWQIDDSPFWHTVDKIQIGDSFYSSKPPTLAFLGAGVYTILHNGLGLDLVWEECFPDRTPTNCRAVLEPAETDWAYFILVFLLVSTPATVILAVAYRLARRRGMSNWSALPFVLLLGLGTGLFPYSTIFVNHLLSVMGIFLAGAILLSNEAPSPRQLAFAGFWVTLSATVDLSATIFLLGFLAYVVIRYRQKSVPFMLGALVPGILAILLNMQISGSPLPPQLITRGYEFEGSSFKIAEPIRLLLSPGALKDADPESYAQTQLSGRNETTVFLHAFNMLVGDYGLFAFYPIVFWYLLSMIRALKAVDRTTRGLAQTVSATILLYVIYFALRPHTFGGFVFGPRWLLNPVPVMALFALDPQLYRVRPLWKPAVFLSLGIISLINTYPGALNPWNPAYPLFRLTYTAQQPRETIAASLSGYGDFSHVSSTIRDSFGLNTVPRRWFDARSGFVIPPGESWWFIHESTPLPPQLAGPLGLDLSTSYALNADLSRQAQDWLTLFTIQVFQSEVLVPADGDAVTAVSLPITFTQDSDGMALVGYQLTQNEDELTLVTAWQVETRSYPISERKIFVHLLADDGTVAAQNDTFAARYDTLFPGDLFFQVQTIALDGLPSGSYWLQLGLYDPETGVRLLAGGQQDRILLQSLILNNQ